MMDLVAATAVGVAALAYLAGLLLTAATGSARPVKVLLVVLSSIFGVMLVGGLIFSRGLLVYLLFQIIAAILILYLIVIFGAVCGAGIYAYQHKKPRGKPLSKPELGEYLPLAEFCTLEGITEERALARIQSTYYRGGLYADAWYIHKSELSRHKPA